MKEETFNLSQEEAHQLVAYISENYDVQEVRMSQGAGGCAVRFKYELEGYEVQAEIHEHNPEQEVPAPEQE